MNEIKQNKKKWKYFVFPLIAIILILSAISTINYFQYKDKLTAQSEEQIIQEAVNKGEISAQNLKRLANPRLKIRNSTGYEVVGIDHEGTLISIGNISLNWTASNNNAGFGYFQFLGDSIRTISKGWFVQLNTTNITSNRWCNSTACFSTEQFTIDTDTFNTSAQISALDTFNTTQQMRDAVNNTNGLFNITSNVSIYWNNSVGMNTTQHTFLSGVISILPSWILSIIPDNWGGNQTRIENNIIANGSQQWHDQNLNSTNDVKFNQINSTGNITIQYGNKQCWANSTHPCWGWNMCNATACYTGVGV